MFTFITIAVDVIIFIIGIAILSFIKDNAINYYENKMVKDIDKWLPIEQIKEFKQLFYLIFAGLLFANLYYLIIINTSFNYLFNCVMFDFILSVIAGIYIFDKDNIKKTLILLITLVPLTGLSFTGWYGNLSVTLFLVLEIIHILGIIYIIIHSVESFKKYSISNKLGYTILILYIIVFISVFLSSYAEDIGLLDSLVYCSNAFTSNGYGLVNATNAQGKIISLILVWSGYILSGVSTAILTVALTSNYYKKRFKNVRDKMESQEAELIELNKKFDEKEKQEIELKEKHASELREINKKLDQILDK